MSEFAGMRNLDVWYSRLDVAALAAAVGGSQAGRDGGRASSGLVAKAQVQGPPPGAGQAHPPGRRRSAGSSATRR